MNDQNCGNPKRGRFVALWQPLRPDLLRYVYWLSRDRDLAEDVVHETRCGNGRLDEPPIDATRRLVAGK
jgi:hypothetical protein